MGPCFRRDDVLMDSLLYRDDVHCCFCSDDVLLDFANQPRLSLRKARTQNHCRSSWPSCPNHR